MKDIECVRHQNDQFKALSFIYLDQFQILKETAPQKFNILCKPYIGNQYEYQINLMFQFSKNYPRDRLKYQIQPLAGITRDNLYSITTKIQEILYENRDKPIVYDIVEETRLWIHEYLVEGKAYQTQSATVQKKQQIFQRPKFSAFTPVTVESFTAWKKQFQEKNKAQKIIKKQKDQKLTGKQWFLGKKEEEIQEESSEEDDEDYEEEEEQEQEKMEYVAPERVEENNDLFS